MKKVIPMIGWTNISTLIKENTLQKGIPIPNQNREGNTNKILYIM